VAFVPSPRRMISSQLVVWSAEVVQLRMPFLAPSFPELSLHSRSESGSISDVTISLDSSFLSIL
jgi:hypothetical protein